MAYNRIQGSDWKIKLENNFSAYTLISFSGKNGAGACTATGLKVGDKILGITGTVAADVGDKASLFESVVTVADQIQQSSATDLSTKVFMVLVLRMS